MLLLNYGLSGKNKIVYGVRNHPFTSPASATNRSRAPSDRDDMRAGPMGWADRLMASSGWGLDGAYWTMNVS